MKSIELSIDGCDDSTSIDITVTKEQFEFIKQLAKQFAETSTYGCMPVMSAKINGKYIWSDQLPDFKYEDIKD